MGRKLSTVAKQNGLMAEFRELKGIQHDDHLLSPFFTFTLKNFFESVEAKN